MNDEHVELAFGYHHGLPSGTRAAWGARLIITQDGSTDLLHDRQSAAGHEALVDKTLAWLNAVTLTTADGRAANAVGKAREAASGLLRNYAMRLDKEEEFTLYRDEQGTIVGNTNASYGYLYIVAYLFESVGTETPCIPRSGCGHRVRWTGQTEDGEPVTGTGCWTHILGPDGEYLLLNDGDEWHGA